MNLITKAFIDLDEWDSSYGYQEVNYTDMCKFEMSSGLTDAGEIGSISLGRTEIVNISIDRIKSITTNNIRFFKADGQTLVKFQFKQGYTLYDSNIIHIGFNTEGSVLVDISTEESIFQSSLLVDFDINHLRQAKVLYDEMLPYTEYIDTLSIVASAFYLDMEY